MVSLKQKIDFANHILKKNLKESKKGVYVAWSGGKESTVMLHLLKILYQNKVPIPVLFGDSSLEHEEVYKFIKSISERWQLTIVRQEIPGLQSLMETKKTIKDIIPRVKKTFKRSLENIVIEKGINVLFWGSRWQDHNGETRVVSEKKFGTKLVYPLIHFNEYDIWNYILHFNVPYLKLYEKGYRNINILPLMKSPTESSQHIFQKMIDHIRSDQLKQLQPSRV
ncbi:hypothetical protein COV49_01290 [Candidatus Falkowbacteria bacterium CG11_big_fil_rev_8_21_14_0_20_39_10]|uniref:Phosphoadenosine phosphosulphate reductase domain-containing protein n=1 Tax=Candidatus Falkowbacteria bacterium CG11_big_fil_rev_8_21_14_0_20_39_10 TaxID=1974570 RepID=A0A2M6K9V3_9BACT|nr:MAG: hypothetical protein COV49_01290 [Candidatus Falkowbacteria bacterium CG11_big_fil_rev_8_21_14_0_20_39_10]